MEERAMKCYAYCYEYAIDRDTGEVEPSYIHLSSTVPDAEHGQVLLDSFMVGVGVPAPHIVAQKAIAMLRMKEAKIKADSIDKLAAIADKVATYTMLEHKPEAEDVEDAEGA